MIYFTWRLGQNELEKKTGCHLYNSTFITDNVPSLIADACICDQGSVAFETFRYPVNLDNDCDHDLICTDRNDLGQQRSI